MVTSEVLEEHALHNATIYRFLRTKTVPRSTHRPPIPQSGEAAVLKNPRPTLHTAEACDNGLPAPIGRPLADELRFYDHETIHQHTRRPVDWPHHDVAIGASVRAVGSCEHSGVSRIISQFQHFNCARGGFVSHISCGIHGFFWKEGVVTDRTREHNKKHLGVHRVDRAGLPCSRLVASAVFANFDT